MVRWFFALFILTFSLSIKAEVLFEGYSKVLLGDTHIGFTIQRYEFDPRKKVFRSISFLRTGPAGGDITESLKTLSDENLVPISYEYTSLAGGKSKTIDAKFNKGQMTAQVKDSGKSKTIRKDIPKGTFLSNFLIYLIMKSKEGLVVDKRYGYSAIAEEDAEIFKGDALVEKEEVFKGIPAFKILNRFKEMKFISHVSDRGEVLGTQSPANSISTEVVANPQDAIGAFGASTAILKTLFGDLPAGQKNVIAQAPATQPSSEKLQGVAPGQGIQIKTAPVPQEKSK